MRVDASSRVRAAALAIHAMDSHSAQWVLSQLPAREAAQLKVLLDELAALGIPADAELLRQAQEMGRTADASTAASASFAKSEAALWTADGMGMLKVLQTEPSQIVAILLFKASWPWTQTVLAALEPSKRMAVKKHLEDLRSSALEEQHIGASLMEAIVTATAYKYFRACPEARATITVLPVNPGSAKWGAVWWTQTLQGPQRLWSAILAPMRLTR